jgi:hypothetical protein
VSGALTINFSNKREAGVLTKFTLYITNGGNSTVTWPSGVLWANGVPPRLTPSGVDVIEFATFDGNNFYATVASRSNKGTLGTGSNAVNISIAGSPTNYTAPSDGMVLVTALNGAATPWTYSRNGTANSLPAVPQIIPMYAGDVLAIKWATTAPTCVFVPAR